MKVRTTITGFAAILMIMALIGGFSAFLRHYVLMTPQKVDKFEALFAEHVEKYHGGQADEL